MEQHKAPEKRRLGRGLSALIPPSPRVIPTVTVSAPEPEVQPEPQQAVAIPPSEVIEGPTKTISISKIVPNTFQPRTEFDPLALEELSASIAVHGVLQPIMVRPAGGDRYELIAGERRYRAAQMAGLTEVPAVVREMTDEESLTVALIENIQREDLNAIEAARGYRQLLDQFSLTQTELARQIGKAQPTIANALRLLRLSPRIQESISLGHISEEHGKALLMIGDETEREKLWKSVIDLGLSVSETRKRATDTTSTPKDSGSPRARQQVRVDELHWQALEDRLRDALGLKVGILPGRGNGGTIAIEFSDADAIDNLIERLQRP